MRLGIIARGIEPGGVKRYVNNLLEEFNKIVNKEIQVIVFTDNPGYSRLSNLKIVLIKKSNKLYWDYIKSIFYIRNENLDFIIYPKNIIPITHLILKPMKINIIHDLAHFNKILKAYPFFDTLYMTSFMKLSCRISSRIVAVSENTKRDIVKILGIDKEKISVVYEGIESSFKNYSRKNIARHIKKPFLFYAGSLSPRKNIFRLLKAFERIKNHIPHNLYITGGKKWGNNKIEDLMEKLSYRVKRLGEVSEEQLRDLYSEAEVFIYPSLYEGFGLPILEAQACGCPVISSNSTSLPEVGGKSVYYIDPYNEEEISLAILKILRNKKLKERLVKKGYNNIKRFSWKKSAQEILDLLAKFKKKN